MLDFLFNDDANDKKSKEATKSTKTNKHKYEFSEDVSTVHSNTDVFAPAGSYSNSGVKINELSSAIEIEYNGLLSSNENNQLFAVVGYGNNLSWEDVEQYTMVKKELNSFNVVIPVRRSGNINIAFKDGAENWDNNSGLNYTFNNYFYKASH